jgi:peptide/nickel transport system substrate-binding protein
MPLFQRLGVVITTNNMTGVKPDPLAPITWNIASWQHVTP